MSPLCAFSRFGASMLMMLALSNGAHASWAPNLWRGPPSINNSEENIKLPRIVQDVLDEISRVETSPTCQRKAMTGLLNACGHFDSSEFQGFGHEQQVLENYDKLYAIRLTRCELDDTDVQFPKLCHDLFYQVPSADQFHESLRLCITQIHSIKGTAWTTYMHKRERTSIMCRAVRAQHDKDEEIRLYQFLAKEVRDLGEAVNGANLNISQVADLVEMLSTQVGSYHETLRKDFQYSQTVMKKGFVELQHSLHSTRENLKSLEQAANNGLISLKQQAEEIKDAKEKAVALGTDVGAYGTQLDILNTKFDAFTTQLATSGRDLIGQLKNEVFAVTNSIELAQNVGSQLSARLDHVNDQLSTTFGLVGQMNASVGDTLSQQQTMRTQFQELHADLNQTLESVESLNEAAGKLASMGTAISGFLGLFQGFSMNGASLELWTLMTAISMVISLRFMSFGRAVIVALLVGIALNSVVARLLQLAPLSALDNHPYAVLIVGGFGLAVICGVCALDLVRQLVSLNFLTKTRPQTEYDLGDSKY